ncbi:MAG: DEAD/DEAH box helicase [Pseudobdellovibrionaceae bacterium]
MKNQIPMKTPKTPVAQSRFEEMNLSQKYLQNLEKMKIENPTDIQSKAIPEGMAGSDLIAVAQTGSGKTLAFALPLLHFLDKNIEARALVLAPSREMAQQIHKVMMELCGETEITNCLVIGGTPSAKQIKTLRKNPRLIVGTPGRLNDHLIGNKLLLQHVEFIVIDEADRMLDMGFLPQLRNIQSTLRGQRQTLLFSASMNPTVESVTKIFMKSTAVMIRSAEAEKPVHSLNQTVLLIDKSAKNDRLLDELNATRGGVIVFCGNQGSCERLGQYLKEYGYSVDLIHSGLSQGQRNRVVRDFREGKTRILVATDLLARGIDIPHVDHVINFDLPFKSEDFLHRIGRTARAGRVGNALTFVTESEARVYLKIKPYLQGAKEVKVDPAFTFSERGPAKFKNKNASRKKGFDPTQKSTTKPYAPTIGRFDKLNKHTQSDQRRSNQAEVVDAKPLRKGDKYSDLAAKSAGTGKPSVWKKTPNALQGSSKPQSRFVKKSSPASSITTRDRR